MPEKTARTPEKNIVPPGEVDVTPSSDQTSSEEMITSTPVKNTALAENDEKVRRPTSDIANSYSNFRVRSHGRRRSPTACRR